MLAPLATTADLTARGVTVDPADATVYATYLDVASAAVRDAAGSPISSTTSTVSGLYGDGDRLMLPGPPVTAVTTVTIDGTTVTDYKLIDGSLYRDCWWLSPTTGCPAPVTVTYTHGLPQVPADVVDLVCRMTISAVVAAISASDGSGLAVNDVASERLGDYSVTYNSEAGVTEMELSDRTRARLRARFGDSVGMVRTR
jgi:hypothetical protein